ncbi:MAG: efflux RND transporter periplasmic adaptor subunit [Anaerolineae bacterium]|nr:efflux RND transporter periplasmic adaptor subunit [Anaerolineae bacterium]
MDEKQTNDRFDSRDDRNSRRLRRSRVIVGSLLLTLVIVIVQQVQARSLVQQAQVETLLEASGVIQAQQVSVASEFGGLIALLPVAESESVAKGTLLVQLDTGLLDAEIEAMQATVDMAEAGLAQAQAGARQGQIAVANAQLLQAETGIEVAQQAVSDTQKLVETPQDIDLQIAVTRAQLQSAEHQLAKAVALKDAVEVLKEPVDEAWDEYGNMDPFKVGVLSGNVAALPYYLPSLPSDIGSHIPEEGGEYRSDDWEISVDNGEFKLSKWVNVSFPLDATLLPNVWWQSWIGVNSAGAQKDGLDAKLANLYVQRANPQAMVTRLDEAQSAYQEASAQTELARIQVEAMEAGATREQIAALEARVAQARAGLAALQEKREMLAIKAPLDGTVMDLMFHQGEVASAGATLLTLADLEDMSLTVYVPENHLGRVQIGQSVQIKVNSFPGRVFEGQVARIADQAEFTPRNVATQEERVNLVFAVEIRVLNEENVLKPGMPADVVFGK